MQRGLVHRDSWPEMLGWVPTINYSPNLFMGLLQSLTHRRNWRKHFNPSSINCYPLFVSTGTSLSYIECSPFRIRDQPFQIQTLMHSIRKSSCCSHTWIKGASWEGCSIRHIRCFRLRSDLVAIFSHNLLSLLVDLPPMGSSETSHNSCIDKELYFFSMLALAFRYSANMTAH